MVLYPFDNRHAVRLWNECVWKFRLFMRLSTEFLLPFLRQLQLLYLHGDVCTETVLLLKKKKGASACVGVCFCLSKLCQLPENGPAWMKWAKQEGVRVKPLIKEAVSANILFIIVLCRRTLLWCCSVVRLSCFCVLQFSTAHTNSDSSSCVWLYNYHEAWAYYLQRNCGAGILHTFRKYTVYKTSETFHSRQYSWVMLL